MKKIILLLFIVLNILILNAQTDYYYYYNNQKIELTLNREYLNIIVDENFRGDVVNKLEKSNFNTIVITSSDNSKEVLTVLKVECTAKSSDKDYFENVNMLKKIPGIKNVGFYFERGNNAPPIGISNVFYVKLKTSKDFELLKKLADEKGVEIVKEVPYMPNWYILSANSSKFGTSLELSNQFYETGFFECIDPAFMFDFKPNNTSLELSKSNKSHEVSDVHLSDSGSIIPSIEFSNATSIDFNFVGGNLPYPLSINVEQAWGLTTGENTKVAVLDVGILETYGVYGQILPLAYDCYEGTELSPCCNGTVYQYFDATYHYDNQYYNAATQAATFIAGTIPAGILHAGVAPGSKLINVKHPFSGNQMSAQLASGISWAWQNGADVINNSWGDNGGAAYNNYYSPILEAAIQTALSDGRNGKGTVVVFMAGNVPEAIDYPANCNDDILVVSTVNSIFFNSGYGNKLDVVASGSQSYPLGIDKSTITSGSKNPTATYIRYLQGSSIAAATVSGLAALVLSANPCLTATEVNSIIEQTAQKIHSEVYDYANTNGKPNGTWNEEMGYGLIDAYEAVLLALDYIDPTYSLVAGDINTNTLWNTNKWVRQPFTVNSGATLTITSTVKCSPNVSITIQPGGKLIVNGGTLTNACSGELWEGILLQGNYDQPQQAQYQGRVELVNGAVIENAKCGILVRNKVPTDGVPSFITENSGGIISATDATFKNNYVAVEMSPYISTSINFNLNTFTKCNFIINHENLFSANNLLFATHVKLDGVTGVRFLGCQFNNSPFGIGQMGGGGVSPVVAIKTMDAGFQVTDHCSSLLLDCDCLNGTLTRNTFSGFEEAIKSNTTGAQHPITIDHALFSDNYHGINIQSINNVIITRSDFSLYNYQFGIILDNASGYKVEGNDFISASENMYDNTCGIYVSNSGAAENMIYRNTFSGLTAGIMTADTNADNSYYPYLALAPGLQFNCNTFSGNYCDIGALGFVRRHQGSSSKGADNIFLDNSTWNILSDYDMIYVYSSANNHFPSESYTNKANTFMHLIDNATANPCNQTICGPFILDPWNPGGDWGMISSGGKSTNPLTQYNQMKSEYNTLSSDFQSKNYGQVLSTMNSKNNIHSKETIAKAKAQQEAISALSRRMADISDAAIREVLSDSILVLDNLKLWYDAVHTPIAKYSLVETHYQDGEYALADAALQNIPNLFDFTNEEMAEHYNYERFHAMKNQLQLAEKRWSNLTEEEIDELIAIAEANTGRSSTMAKGVLCFYFDICYEKEWTLPTTSLANFKSKSAQQENGIDNITRNINYTISLYPNPTQSSLTIEISNSEVQLNQVEIMDLLGKVVKKEHFTGSTKTLNIGDLKNGIYMLRIHLNNGEIVNEKVVKN